MPFYLLKNPKNQNFEKWKNLLEISSFYTCVPKITIIWCTVPEIESETDNFFCQSGPLFALYPHHHHPMDPQNVERMKKPPKDIIILQMFIINDSHMMYGSWDMGCNRQNFLSFWTIFCPFTTYNPKNQNFEKIKKPPGDIIILHRCNINYNHMMYGSWNTFWTIFCTFTAQYTKNIKTLKKWKIHLEILSFYTCIP